MSQYPNKLDNDKTIIRVDDNITEIGGDAINQLRDAVFNIEKELGTNPSGSKNNVKERLDVSLDDAGNIKPSALSYTFAPNPITDANVDINAKIHEDKLDLTHSTQSLHDLFTTQNNYVNNLITTTDDLNTNINNHISGATVSGIRHDTTHIDLATNLLDKDGYNLSTTTVDEALVDINTVLNVHQNLISNAHPASAITVDTSNFTVIDQDANTVQKALENIDKTDQLHLGEHRATLHSSGVPADARSTAFDGYGELVVPWTSVETYLANNGINPIDDVNLGDNVIKFKTPSGNAKFLFESQFSQVKPGDVISVNYNNGIIALFEIDSIRFDSSIEDYYLRINGTNLFQTTDGYAKIEKPLHDTNIYSVLTLASANATPSTLFAQEDGGLIVGDPKAASVLGIGFNANLIDSTHYMLYLQLYPTGNPVDKVIDMIGVDVSGNAGATPGKYTLESVVQSTNDTFRAAGYNFRFIAYALNGCFGIALADSFDGASFSIVSGVRSDTVLTVGTYVNNVIDDISAAKYDALGFGINKANVASPAYNNTFTSSDGALLPTKIIRPRLHRNYIVNGKLVDRLAPARGTTNGFWSAILADRFATGGSVKVKYTIEGCMYDAGLAPGKSITVLPAISPYSNVDYGRFIIEDVVYTVPCGPSLGQTDITVLNAIHNTGSPVSISTNQPIEVRIYAGSDSIVFNDLNLIEGSPSGKKYHRLHEVFINDKFETFAHERARMPIQTITPDPQLDTNNFQIKNVSPKLRGYLKSNKVSKFVRLYITDYRFATGEYDGYIGRPALSGNGIDKVGPIATGKKNEPVKFYDETYNDYIELVYIEPNVTSPGSDILPSSVDRFVDIELFPSLQHDDELTFLGIFELSEKDNNKVVRFVEDKRQIGSISEKDLTQNVINFINATARMTQENGIVKGFDYDSQNISNTREFFFKGGIAIVNGKTVIANNQSCTLAEIKENGHVGAQDIDWAICVNEFGYLEPVIITDNPQQFYAVSGSNSYLVPSYTFNELLLNRRDLCPINIITVTINSFSYVKNKDVRKGIVLQNYPLVLASAGYNGNFTRLDQLLYHIENNVQNNSTVKVKGNVSFTEDFELKDLPNSLVIDGEGTGTLTFNNKKFIVNNSNVALKNLTINLNSTPTESSIEQINGKLTIDNCIINIHCSTNSEKGIKPSSNFRLENCTINYYTHNQDIYATGELVNPGRGGAVIFDGNIIENIIIQNNKFNAITGSLSFTPMAVQRSPFIIFNMYENYIVNNVNIENNTFNDNNSASFSGSAICFYNNDNNITSGNYPVIANIFIDGNICNQNQSITITTASTGVKLDLKTHIIPLNVNIINNSCGFIGYIINSKANVPTLSVLSDKYQQEILIENNKTHAIVSPFITSSGSDYYIPLFNNSTDSPVFATGKQSIINNNTHMINIFTLSKDSNNEFGSVYVLKNNIDCNRSSSIVSMFLNSSNPIILYKGISIYSGSSGSFTNLIKNNYCEISNNYITSGYYSSSLHKFDIGINCNNCHAIITNNTIKNLNNGISFGITANTGIFNINNNNIYRYSSSIGYYIYAPASSVSVETEAKIYDNYLDSTTSDGSNEDTIYYDLSYSSVYNNKNHINLSIIPHQFFKWLRTFVAGPFTEIVDPFTSLYDSDSIDTMYYSLDNSIKNMTLLFKNTNTNVYAIQNLENYIHSPNIKIKSIKIDYEKQLEPYQSNSFYDIKLTDLSGAGTVNINGPNLDLDNSVDTGSITQIIDAVFLTSQTGIKINISARSTSSVTGSQLFLSPIVIKWHAV
jgi:hypothetical protein